MQIQLWDRFTNMDTVNNTTSTNITYNINIPTSTVVAIGLFGTIVLGGVSYMGYRLMMGLVQSNSDIVSLTKAVLNEKKRAV